MKRFPGMQYDHAGAGLSPAGAAGRHCHTPDRQFEEMAGMTLLCSDKTGTLTLNTMVIQVCPLSLIQ